MKRTERGFTLIELMIVIAIIAVIAAIAIPGLLQSQRASNERSASASLKTLASAEVDLRANDRDANKVNDFWTFNVKGLYTLTPHMSAATGLTTDAIRLIDLGVAGADAALTSIIGPHCVDLTLVTAVSAKAGFWYQALLSDQSGTPETYLVNTAGTAYDGTPVTSLAYHGSKFGFIAYPESMTSGRMAYILNESNSILRRALTMTPKASTSIPPGLATAPFNEWPTDAALKLTWSKLD